MADTERPDLSAKVQSSDIRPTTAVGQCPNWRDSDVLEENFSHDVSVLTLVVPFGILPVNNPRIVSTAKSLRQQL